MCSILGVELSEMKNTIGVTRVVEEDLHSEIH